MDNKRSQDLAYVAVFTALIIALGVTPAIPVSSLGVPILLQNLGIMLTGLILGPRRSVYTVGLFLLISLTGLPVLSGGRSGLTAIVSPTAGFLLGYLPMVIVIGLVAKVSRGRNLAVNLGAVALGGIIVHYACGILGLMLVSKTAFTPTMMSLGVYLPGDLLKCFVAAPLAVGVHRAFPHLMPAKPQKNRELVEADATSAVTP